jgi:hypothetical protein
MGMLSGSCIMWMMPEEQEMHLQRWVNHYKLILWVANDEKINHYNFYNSLLGVFGA